MKENCGNCKFMQRDFSKPQGEGYTEFCCKNEKSEEYATPIFRNDTCDDWEEDI